MRIESAVLEAKSISKSYPGKSDDQELSILENTSLSIKKGSTVSIIGSSGSGKSTLLHILGGLEKPDSGEVYWNDTEITDLSSNRLAELRNKEVGFVFQFHHLLPEFSALENVYMPALIGGKSINYARKRGMELLGRFGIAERSSHKPAELSGGEQQRVAVARALMNKPNIILADEPSGNLDEKNTDILLNLLFELNEDGGMSIVIVTHEMIVAKRADIMYRLSDRKLSEI